VDAHNLELVLGHDSLDLWQQLVPNAKGGRRAPYVCLAGPARTHPRVEPQSNFPTRTPLSKSLKLGDGASIDMDP
jgi:hypothetical protein